MKYIFALALLTSLALCAFAQEPDRWRGMIIDQSTPDDAIKAFGPPESDKLDRIFASGLDANWLTKKHKEKIFRTLVYKKLDGVKRAQFSFKDDKLVYIFFWLEKEKEVAANALNAAYSVEFAPRFSGFDQAVSPQNYERNQGKVYPKVYPSVYDLVAVTPKTFIVAGVGNVGFGKVLRESAGIADSNTSFPGKASSVTIVSRTLENRDGADALKE